MNRNHTAVRLSAAAVSLLAASAFFSACSTDSDGDASETVSTDGSTAGSVAASTSGATAFDTAITTADMWVKATDTKMTGVFGILENTSTEDVTLVSASTDLAGSVELHETVDNGTGKMVMQEKKDGFRVPAGGKFELAPGGNHIMLMGLDKEIETGQAVTIKFELSNGDTSELTATARDTEGGGEDYNPGAGASADPTGMHSGMGEAGSDMNESHDPYETGAPSSDDASTGDIETDDKEADDSND